MLTKRDSSVGIIFLSAIVPGRKIKSSVSDGDEVTLRIDDEDVLVRNVSRTSPGQFSGDVYGFEPSYGIEFGGLKIGDRIDFTEDHVISCHGPETP